MNKTIYVAALYNGRPNLIKVLIEKETDKTIKLKQFSFSQTETLVHIVGHDTPRFLYGRQLHKADFRWRYTAQEALELLRELVREDVQIKKNVLQKAESELGYVERFKLLDEEQADG